MRSIKMRSMFNILNNKYTRICTNNIYIRQWKIGNIVTTNKLNAINIYKNTEIVSSMVNMLISTKTKQPSCFKSI